jgi:hypothetical protein
MSKNKNLDEFTQKLQEQIIDQYRKYYSEKVIELWVNSSKFLFFDMT